MFSVMAHSIQSGDINPFAFSLNDKNLEQMAMVIETLPFGGHLRLVSSNQYVLANLIHAKQLGFQKVEDVTQVSYAYIAKHRRNCIAALEGDLQQEAAYQEFICEANDKITQTKQPYHFEVCTLFPTGFIYIGSVQKIPLLDASQNVHAVLTISQDITARSELIDLYVLYRKHYGSGKQAIAQFMKYLNLETVFNVLPTHRELLTLLMFRKDARAKYVARQLALSDRTVEEYKSRLRHKLKHPVSLEALLLKLRHPHGYSFEDA